MSRRHFLGTSAAVLGAATLAASPAAAQGAYDTAELLKAGPLPEMVLGSADAPVTVVEYASMTCGHCAHFAETVFPTLKSKYIDTGKVRFVFREFPLDPIAAAVSMLVRCSPPDKFFDVLDVYFAKQREWIDPKAPVDALSRFSKQFGFTDSTFRACLGDQKTLDGLNQTRTRGADVFGIDGTPTFFVNGRKIVGISTVEELDKALAPVLK
ncbi:DsbA family protein [Siculibacillus lacustris]|uniref:DsbA family protein n=1 Tax=Siculibacillus lacustris TaxID=1549641 RepID=A0A4V2KSY9_9HYPH|nr:DsbA family protein [Siculibacillus lacustris]TBW34994.1 DsbA family protein [Siculibacillus lacustris]